MGLDTVTLQLSGDVSLDDLSLAVSRLRTLLNALAKDVAGGAEIIWLVDSLDAGSALTTYRGLATKGGEASEVERVVRAYGEVGTALERNSPITYSRAVAKEARGLLKVLGTDRVESLRFETPETDATIWGVPQQPQIAEAVGAYGAVEGRVQTLSSRGGLRFTLYDTLSDRAVSCYFAEDFDEELMRDAWGRRAIVEGWVRRDAITGRPLTIRRVTNVTVLPEGEPGSYRDARAVAPLRDGDLMPEVVIRRLRDG